MPAIYDPVVGRLGPLACRRSPCASRRRAKAREPRWRGQSQGSLHPYWRSIGSAAPAARDSTTCRYASSRFSIAPLLYREVRTDFHRLSVALPDAVLISPLRLYCRGWGLPGCPIYLLTGADRRVGQSYDSRTRRRFFPVLAAQCCRLRPSSRLRRSVASGRQNGWALADWPQLQLSFHRAIA